MKILLAYQSGLPHRNDPYISLVPTGLCYLHACLREAGHDSTLANFSAWSTARVKQELLSIQPDFIGISQWTHNRHSSLDLARTCRNLLPDSTIVMGGGHATFCYEDLLSEGSPVDAVVLGEGESTLLELVSQASAKNALHTIAGLAFRHNGTIKTTAARMTLEDLDQLPLPARHLDRSVGFDLELQAEFIVSTRGCPSACFFCSSPDFWGKKVRFRSPQAIVDEIKYIRQKFGLIYFSIRDDTFTADRRRVLEFCSLLQKQDVNILWNCQSRVNAIDDELVTAMKRAGCECIQLGVESGSPRILKQLGKTIAPPQIEKACTLVREIGINLSIYLISDVPGETEEDIRQTLELVRHIHPDDGYVSPLAYYPGTKLYNDAVTSGRITSSIFADSAKSALYVTSKSGQPSATLLKELTKSRQNNAERFKAQKKRLGYCYTTNVIAGEWYRQRGEYEKAEDELLEITTNQPGNPWGWFLLGDLYSETGRIKKAKESYAKVLSIIPHHSPSKSAQ
ncbi:MAG: radical SAM protein [Desulfuromonadaceae bacterium]|nr:radical SAM protein [Desulfuromonadaceae bacterium]MDD2847399.1 radical SAM protein [Desulfuromonadaceae bacterium]MDD4131488.1 radical SAM protein [Desulfuromonadaceae bacterium]